MKASLKSKVSLSGTRTSSFDELRKETKEGFDGINDRFDRLYHVLIGAAVVIVAALIGAAAAIVIALISTPHL
jgi:hypothetical protein